MLEVETERLWDAYVRAEGDRIADVSTAALQRFLRSANTLLWTS